MADSKSLVRNIIMLLAVFAVAVAGVYLGGRIRQQPTGIPPESADFSSKLDEGAQFPAVELYAEDSSRVHTADLLAGKPAVVLFLEVGCPPCKVMTARWQKLLAEGDLTGISLFGITFSPLRELRKYRLENGLTFPIYADSANVFMSDFDVTSYPFMIALDRTGKVVMNNYDANAELDPNRLRQLLGL